jgi:hypothetical protein
MKQYKFLGGMPRSGGTLLASILYQNPSIHTEGLSALGWLMWNAHLALNIDQTHAARRQEHAKKMVAKLPDMHYENVSRPIVVDRSRAWSSNQMKSLLLEYFKEPKVVCQTRDRNEVLRSFEKLFERNNKDFYASNMYTGFQRAEDATLEALRSKDQMFLFVDYGELVDSPQTTLERIYEFWDLPKFKHDFQNVKKATNEDDSVYGLVGMHEVRPIVGRIKQNVISNDQKEKS